MTDSLPITYEEAASSSSFHSRKDDHCLPHKAMRWTVINCASNGELAALTNVSPLWRQVAVEEIQEILRHALIRSEKQIIERDGEIPKAQSEPATARKPKKNSVDGPMSTGESSLRQHHTPLASLLLPSMVLEKARRKLRSKPKRSSNPSSKPAPAKDTNETYCLSWFHPDGIQLAEDVNPDLNLRIVVGSGDSAGTQLLSTCVSEWHSYQDAVDILQPFGYNAEFIEEVLSLPDHILTDAHEDGHTSRQPPVLNGATTYAVRGATVAKPQPHPEERHQITRYSRWGGPREALSSEHLRDSFPRAILERRHHIPSQVSSVKSPIFLGTNTPQNIAVQFLNHSKARAVCMKTPPFANLEKQPITIFLVGIATEDGIFASGLNRRFLLGHVYPHTRECESVDRSNVCISTDCNDSSLQEGLGEGSGAMTSTTTLDGVVSKDDDKSTDGGDIYRDSTQSMTDLNLEGEDESMSSDEESSSSGSESDPDENVICRGKVGPGQWHCYTAVFDGGKSCIRVDGLCETSPTADGGMMAFESAGDGELDGLTIGADHKFHVSLCFGEGSDGEGEGAISELVVFKGRLAQEDIIQMESYLMNKHSIPKAVDSVRVWEDDENRRKVHFLISQPPPYFDNQTSIPLKFAAQHPSVSWYKENPVTGTKFKIKRIGCRITNGESSDW